MTKEQKNVIMDVLKDDDELSIHCLNRHVYWRRDSEAWRVEKIVIVGLKIERIDVVYEGRDFNTAIEHLEDMV